MEHLWECVGSREFRVMQGQLPPNGAELSIINPVPAKLHLSSEAEHRLHLSAALTVYMNVKPFSILQENYFLSYQQHFTAFPHYHPPSRDPAATYLLHEVYAHVSV